MKALVEKNSKIVVLVGNDSIIESLSKTLTVFDVIEVDTTGSNSLYTDEGIIKTMSIYEKGKSLSSDARHLVIDYPDIMSLKDVHDYINNN